MSLTLQELTKKVMSDHGVLIEFSPVSGEFLMRGEKMKVEKAIPALEKIPTTMVCVDLI